MGKIPIKRRLKWCVTFSFILNNPLFISLRAQVTGGAQVSVGMNGIHDLLYDVTKGVLKVILLFKQVAQKGNSL